MRDPLTIHERLEAARAELWLCRLTCDLTLARWASAIPATPAIEPEPAGSPPRADAVQAPAEQVTSWPVWQPIWLHDRCRPMTGRVVTAR